MALLYSFTLALLYCLILPDPAHAEPISATLAAIGSFAAANAPALIGATAAIAGAGITASQASKAAKGVKDPTLVQAPTGAGSSASETAAGVASLRKRRIGARGYQSNIIGGLADAYRPELKATFGQ